MKKILISGIAAILILTGLQLNNYSNYKNNLINEFGLDTYQLMNQEAGITNEIQSILHYTIYGI